MALRNRIGFLLDGILLGVIGLFLAILFIVISANVLGFINIFVLKPPLDAAEFAQIISAAGSIILYFGLVILYREQALIQKRQEGWMEAEHTPDLSVERWEVNGNEVELDITNLGNGIAKELRVEISVDILTGTHNMNDVNIMGAEELWRTDVISRVIEQQQLEPPRVFSGVPEFTLEWYKSGQKRPKSIAHPETLVGTFSDIASKLHNEGAEVISYNVDISYNYVINRFGGAITIWAGEAELEEDMDFEGAILETFESYDRGLGVEPDNRKDLAES